MKVSVEKEVVEKVLSVTIEVGGNILTLKPNGILGLEERSVPEFDFVNPWSSDMRCSQKTTYTIIHVFGECEVTEEVYLNCLKMMGN